MRRSSFKMASFVLFILFAASGIAQTRITNSINDSWQFAKAKGIADTTGLHWQPVTLPHSWNTADVMDDEPGYYRGPGLYRRKLSIPASFRGRSISLRFEGANQYTIVFVNGKQAATHVGGYNAFEVPISQFLNYDSVVHNNEVFVSVDNSYNPDIAPLTADFTFFGGLYRDAWMVVTNPVHFAADSAFGSSGPKVSVTKVDSTAADLHVENRVVNNTISKTRVQLSTAIYDMEGNPIVSKQSRVTLNGQTSGFITHQLPVISRPHLWSVDDPYLYTAITTITDLKSGQQLDEQTTRFGFRWFSFDATKGFFLNGQPLKLVGASRHQDRPDIGNAVPDELARQDVELLKKMGGNFLRVAHYPQDPSVLEACDRLGVLASVEIPVVNEITESDAFTNNCLHMQREMIRQNYNHPSVVIWCYMNEILLKPHFNNDKPRQKVYFEKVLRLAKQLDSLTRNEDPSRPTMIANHGDFDRYNSTGLTAVPDIVGWNLYSGWYGGELQNFPAFLDKHHKAMPGKPLIVSEYGADADPRIHSFTPVRFDKSVEYATKFHQYYLAEMLKRPFVVAALAWNLADFNSETREETMPHINNKGLLRWDRTPKAPYYYYQSRLLNKPYLKINSAGWTIRSGIADSLTATCIQPVQVSTNLDSVELFINGKSAGWKKPDNGIAEWDLPFIDGNNRIEARSADARSVKARSTDVRSTEVTQTITDNMVVEFRLQPFLLNDEKLHFRSVNVLLGAKRYFVDETKSLIWIPDQPYRVGSWGSIGGKAFNQSGNNRMPYGSDKNISGTGNDPVYQTQQTGISQYRFDVPDGEYELILHFAELRGVAGSNLVYNLSETTRKDERIERVFNVSVNNQPLLTDLNIAARAGIATALESRQEVSIHNGKGLLIDFKSITGEPVLNAIQLRKL